MGLDNIPKNYACVKQNTAIRNADNQIDCDATIKAGKCPWDNAYKSDPLVKDSNPTYGMFGMHCWYRGKYGNYLLDEARNNSLDFERDMGTYDFYGDDEDEDGNQFINSDQCLSMSEIMLEYKDIFSEDAMNKDWIYAAWWLKFVGENCDGADAWY